MKPEITYIADDIVNLLISILIFYFVYKSFLQLGVSSKNLIQVSEKYTKSRLSDADSKKYQESLLTYMQESRIYIDSDVTLKKLSDNLSISPHDISQVINQKLELNFYDFINQYRLEEARQILVDPKNNDKKIIEILINSGFNSKSVFNSLFKNHYKMTPSQYRKAHY